jgi:dienelactone hydrolase
MISPYKGKSLMSIIIVSDVFGKTPALNKLAAQIEANDIVDPYNGEFIEFKSEAEAYAFFMDNVGLDNYHTLLLNKLETLKSPPILIGFSVGASAIWMLSERINEENVKKAICYYGSQIRHFINIKPNFEVDLNFPKNESHFDVPLLIESLCKTKNVTISKLEYFHGFMNHHSTNYNDIGYKEHVKLLSSNTR